MRSWPPRPTAATPSPTGQAQRRRDGRRGAAAVDEPRSTTTSARTRPTRQPLRLAIAGRDGRQRPWQPGPRRQPRTRGPRWRRPRRTRNGPQRNQDRGGNHDRSGGRIAPRSRPQPRPEASSIAAAAVPRVRSAVVSARSGASARAGRSGGGGQDRAEPHRHPRHPARGLRVPADRRLPARARGRLRVAVPRAQALSCARATP